MGATTLQEIYDSQPMRNSSRVVPITDKGTTKYVQDYEGLDWISNTSKSIVQEHDAVGGQGVPYQTTGVDSELFEYSVFWPMHMSEVECYSPLVTAGVTSFLVLPVVESDIGMTAALLFGYAVGAATFYIANGAQYQLQHAIKIDKAENSELRQLMSQTNFDTEPLFIQSRCHTGLSQASSLSEGELHILP